MTCDAVRRRSSVTTPTAASRSSRRQGSCRDWLRTAPYPAGRSGLGKPSSGPNLVLEPCQAHGARFGPRSRSARQRRSGVVAGQQRGFEQRRRLQAEPHRRDPQRQIAAGHDRRSIGSAIVKAHRIGRSQPLGLRGRSVSLDKASVCGVWNASDLARHRCEQEDGKCVPENGRPHARTRRNAPPPEATLLR